MARLSGEQYEQAISIILARYPGSAQNIGDELNLDLSVADALTLRQLQHFCHFCLHPADPPTSWPGLLVGTGGPTPFLLVTLERQLVVDEYPWHTTVFWLWQVHSLLPARAWLSMASLVEEAL